MRVGIDIDNTLICYDKRSPRWQKRQVLTFRLLPASRRLKPGFINTAYIRIHNSSRSDLWRIHLLAHIFEGVLHFIADAIRQGISFTL